MKKLLLLPAVALLFCTNPAAAQIGSLPRPSEITRNMDMNSASQFHPLNAVQLIQRSNFYGFTGGITTYGGSAEIGKSWMLRKGLHSQLDANFFYLNQDDSPFGGSLYGPDPRYSSSLLLVPIFFGFRRDVWAENFDDSLLPYLEGGVGPVLGFAFPYGYGFFNTFAHTDLAMAGGAYFGTGFDYSMGAKTVGTINMRYNFIYFPAGLAGKVNYSNLSISFGISRALRN